MNIQFKTDSAEDALILGEKIGRHLEAGDIVFLFGDLGAGKTTLTQGIARGLGVAKEEYVRSPTFTLVNEYKGKVPVYHIDLYRIVSSHDLENLGGIAALAAVEAIDGNVLARDIDIKKFQKKLINRRLLPKEILGREIKQRSYSTEELREWIIVLMVVLSCRDNSPISLLTA